MTVFAGSQPRYPADAGASPARYPLLPQATSLDTVEDLEEDAKPEDLMLSYVSGDKSKVRGGLRSQHGLT